MSFLTPRVAALAAVAAVAAALVAAALLLSGVVPPFGGLVDESAYGPAEFAFEPAAYGDLPGWREDNQAEALPAFLRSCARIEALADDAPANPLEALGERARAPSVAGTAADWRPACAGARRVGDLFYVDAEAGARAARGYFEQYFRPLKIIARRPPKPDGRARGGPPRIVTRGVFTGYFEPTYAASRVPTAARSAPVLARPDDLVMVDLGRFREALAGQRIAGYVENGALMPYPDHKAINDGVLEGRGLALAYVDPNDLLFLQIQGSGRLEFEDGAELRVGYDGQNGHPYFAVGRALIDSGEIPREAMSMQAIRRWLSSADPAAARALREANPSYVFFRELTVEDPMLGPLGAEGVQLTPVRSLAVDRRFHAMGAPVWVALSDAAGEPSLRRLFIAQDTGGAITGPIRGDIFFGAGEAAAEEAGVLNAEGEMYVLTPASVAARLLERQAKSWTPVFRGRGATAREATAWGDVSPRAVAPASR